MDVKILYIALIIYVMIMAFAFAFKIKWLYILAGVVWFIPLTEVNNIFVSTICITMIITHFMLGFKNENDDF